MSVARAIINDIHPFFRALEGPFTRSPTYFARPQHHHQPFAWQLSHEPNFSYSEKDGAYTVEAEVPGVKKEDLDVIIGSGGRSVTISGKAYARETPVQSGPKEDAVTEPSGQHIDTPQAETPASRTVRSSFEHTFSLPKAVDGQRVEASLTDGILTLTLPYAADSENLKIEIV